MSRILRWFARLLALNLLLAAPFAASARAQESGWAVSLAVPVDYAFTKDEATNSAPEAESPLGLRINLTTPVRLGFGLGRYRSGFKETAFPWGGRDITYTFAELQFVVPIWRFWVAPGFGLGEAVFSPETVSDGAIEQTFRPSGAQEYFLIGAFRITDRWDAQIGAHLLKIDVKIVNDFGTGPQSDTGDIGARMFSVGVGYHF